ncbi:hypothetical protein BN844_2896 [Pseudomonas sp. SHC52]|nr:hypothetical protein BN844_2896 [Pseudomonas sp. SHC52]
MRTHEAVEAVLAVVGKEIAVHGGQADRRGVHAVEKGFEALAGVLLLILLPEPEQKRGAFAVSELGQVFLAPWVTVVLEQFGAAVGPGISGVAHQVAHQADERQVDRLAQGIAQGGVAAVVLAAEVVEGVQPAAGKERLARAGGIGPIQRRLEHLRQAAVAVLDQVVDSPAGQAILFGDLDFFQRRRGFSTIAVVQLGDDLQIGGEYPQLGGGTEFEFAAFVDVERLVGAIGLHPHARTVRRQFQQGKAVAHLGGAGGGEQAFSHQADLGREGRVGQALEVLGGLGLQIVLQGAGGGQVQAIEVIQRPVEQRGESTAGGADAFVGFVGLDRRLLHPIAITDLARQGGIGQGAVDHTVLGQQPDVAVRQARQFVVPLGQVMGRAALGDHQRQHLPQGQALFRQAPRIGGGAEQLLIGPVEVGAVPDPQTFGHAMDLSMPRHGGQRHAVEVIAHNPLPRLEGLRTGPISAHAGGNHLADFLTPRDRQAIGGVAVLFQLRRQGAAPGGLSRQAQQLGHLRPRRHAEARPIHRRVGLGLAGIEQEAVFDEQQALHHHGGDGVETRIQLLWVLELIQRRGTAIGDGQAGLDLFRIGHEQAFSDVVHQGRRKPRLGLDHVVALEQSRQELPQRAVAQPPIEWASTGIDNGIAGPRLQRVAQGGRVLADLPGLKPGGTHFLGHREPDHHDDNQQQQPERPPAMPRAAFFWGDRRFFHTFSRDHRFVRIGLP